MAVADGNGKEMLRLAGLTEIKLFSDVTANCFSVCYNSYAA
jgi:hypothetical protein